MPPPACTCQLSRWGCLSSLQLTRHFREEGDPNPTGRSPGSMRTASSPFPSRTETSGHVQLFKLN